MPIDAHDLDPQVLLTRMTKAFMLMLAQQPLMSVEFTRKSIDDFPFDEYRINAIVDPESGDQTYLLCRPDEGVVH